MKKLYHFRIATSSGAPFPMHLLADQECWPATTDDAMVIRDLVSGDIPLTHRVPIELMSRKCFSAGAWQGVRWEIAMMPQVITVL